MAMERIRIEEAGCVRLLLLAGVPTMAQLLNICNSVSGRKVLAERSGVAELLLLQWARMADAQEASRTDRGYVELLRLEQLDLAAQERLRRVRPAAVVVDGTVGVDVI